MDLSLIDDSYRCIAEDGIFKTCFIGDTYYFWVLKTNTINIREISEKKFNQYNDDNITLEDYDYSYIQTYSNSSNVITQIDDTTFGTFTSDISYVDHFSVGENIYLVIKDEDGDFYVQYYNVVNKKVGTIVLPDYISYIHKIKILEYKDDIHFNIVYTDDSGFLFYSPNNVQNLQYSLNESFIEDNTVELGESIYTNHKCQVNDKNIIMFQNGNDVNLYYHKYFIYEDDESVDFDSTDFIVVTFDKTLLENGLSQFSDDIKLLNDEILKFQFFENSLETFEDGDNGNSMLFGVTRLNLFDLFNNRETLVTTIESLRNNVTLNTYYSVTANNFDTDFKLIIPKDNSFIVDDSIILLLSKSELMVYDYNVNEFDFKQIDTSEMDLPETAFSTSFKDNGSIEFNIVYNYFQFNNNFSKFEYILESDYNSDVVFVNILRFFPSWVQNNTSLVSIVDVFEKVYNDGMRIPNRNYDFLDVGINYKNLYDADDRLYFLFKQNPSIFFYNKNNTSFGSTLFDKFDKLKNNNNVELVDDEYLYNFLQDLGMEWVYDQEFFENAKKVNMLDNGVLKPTIANNTPVNQYEFVTNQSSDVEVFRNNLDLYSDFSKSELRIFLKTLLNNRWMIHSKSFYKLFVYLLGFMYEVKLMYYGYNTKTVHNINTYEMNSEFADNFNNKVYINIDFEDLAKNTNSIMNSINYVIKIIKKTLPINMCFEGVVFTFNNQIFKLKNDFNSTHVRVIKNY